MVSTNAALPFFVYFIGMFSGGVCLKCRHNTTGDNCQYCKTGFTPDRNRSKTDRKYCKGKTK